MAKCYEVQVGNVRDGIPVSDCGTIVVGDPGSAEPVRIPTAPAATIRSGRLTDLDGDGVLALIRDQSGDGGDWTMCAPHEHADWDAWVATGRQDSALPHTGPPTAEIIAAGSRTHTVYSASYTTSEYLIHLRLGESIEWHRTGRVYGSPRWYSLTACHDGTLALSRPEREALARAVGLGIAYEDRYYV